tara:strand:+ start:1874 stop:2326 length:453 start_codon:yes stop_codon:yes gene_type:complete
MNTPEDLQAIAHLVGATNAQLKSMDENIVSGSANLQASKDNWDPKSVIKNAVGELGLPVSQSQPVHQHQQIQQPVMQPQQPVMQPQQLQQPMIQPQAFITDPQILARLDRIEVILSKLTMTEEKIMKSLLKSNTKQITIRFDDTNNTKQS